jgi:hypothetical protein
MKTKLLGAVVAASFLGACGMPSLEPVVASFNEASVGIQLDGYVLHAPQAERDQAIAAADNMAAQICRRGPNRRAEYVSARNIPTGQYSLPIVERLYLCLR